MKTPIILQILFTTDPTENVEEVKEYTKEELFDDYCSNNEVPDVITERVFELEDANKFLRDKLDAKDRALRILFGETSDKLTYHKKQIHTIIKI